MHHKHHHVLIGALASLALGGCVSPGATGDIEAHDPGSFDGGVLDEALAGDVTLLPFGSVHRYLLESAPTGWQNPGFADSTWKSGPGQLGYGDGDEKTVIVVPSKKPLTTYFRTTFQVANPSAFTALTLQFVRDDGVVLYLNGTEVTRSNMPTGSITSTTPAAKGAYSSDESRVYSVSVPLARLVTGTNVLAAEIHQTDPYSSDISYDAAVLGTPAAATCGDGACGGGEACSSCAADCGSCQAWTCPTLSAGQQVGSIQNLSITENSGMVPSLRNGGVYWMHNDSGDSARIFALTMEGKNLGVYNVSGASASDWEDIAIGPGPAAGTSYVYIGDIGGNGGRNSLSVYRVPEPSVSTAQAAGTFTLSGTVRLNVVYPNSERYDAESMFVDPVNADIYIVTKSSSGNSRVFRAAAPHDPTKTQTLVQVATYAFTTADGANPATTGGDISPDGSEIILRTYNRLYMWHRAPGATVASAFSKTACGYKIITEAQGESACFASNGRDVLLSTEHGWNASVTEPIYRYARQ